MNYEEVFNFTRINDSLSTAGLLNHDQLAMLGAAGYQLVVNLLPIETEYAIKEEGDIVAAQGIDYIYIPVDFSEPQQSDYQQFEQALITNHSQKIMAHCAANYRVSAFYAIYAVHHLGWTPEQAYDFIAQRWDLDEHPVWRQFVERMI